MKKLLIFVLSFAMLLSALPFSALAAEDAESSGDESVEYEYHDEKILTRGPTDFGIDWREYSSYIHYEGNEFGYDISWVNIIVTEAFMAESDTLDASYFPKIEGKINRIKHIEYEEEREYRIFLDWEQLKDNGTRPIYTEEIIDEYISILRYISSFSFIDTIYLSVSYIAHLHDPTDSETTESDVTEPTLTEPVETESKSTDAVTTEPETTESVGAVTESGNNDGNGLNNPQTGDMLFVLLSGLLFSIGVIIAASAVVIKKKVNR